MVAVASSEYRSIMEYGSIPYVGVAQEEKNGCPIKLVQNLMFRTLLWNVVRSFYEPYQSFSSVFISNKTVSVDRNHHFGVPKRQIRAWLGK